MGWVTSIPPDWRLPRCERQGAGVVEGTLVSPNSKVCAAEPIPGRLAANKAEHPAWLQMFGSALAHSKSFTDGLSARTAMRRGVSPPARRPALALGSARFSKIKLTILGSDRFDSIAQFC